jgi:hypothetical protein
MMDTWEIIRARIIERDRGCSGRFLGGKCSSIIDVHHIEPREEGGTDEDSNLMAVCHTHHPMLEAMRKEILRRRGWKTCPHEHRYPGARAACERRLNAALLAA